jgi:hypothetical protein
MILLTAIINTFEKAFLEKYQDIILPSHKKALHAMKRCRSEQGLHMLARCSDPDCTQRVYIPHSCGHRNCPHCQNHENWQWIENQLDKRLPAQYYLITFTLPSQLREVAWKNQKTIYSLMFFCVQDVLKTFTKNDKKLQGAAGFTTVLHTKARNLEYHPHIHVVMPGASINEKTGLWRVKSSKYLFNHKNLAEVFRAKLLEAIVDQGLSVPVSTPEDWVVDCKDVGNGDKAFIYLGKYLYKGVIQEKDILRCDKGEVTFRYMHAKSKEYRTRTIAGEDFLYLLMLHVLPKGFQRTRCYGFLNPCSRRLIKFLQLILRVPPFFLLKQKKNRATITCLVCGATMNIVKTRIRKPPTDFAACLT